MKMFLVCAMAVLRLKIALGSDVEIGVSAINEFINVTGVGLTACGKFYQKLKTTTWQECYGTCARDDKCKAYTWHSADGICTIATNATRSRALKATFSGAQVPIPSVASSCHNPSPAPQPSCPPPASRPSAKPTSPNIVFFLTDDMDKILGGKIQEVK